jgi:ubiquinone/menaquinone biosynthesis C-methylase UbiE
MTPGLHVLDIGCGDGDLMSELASRGCSVFGVEIDGSLVEACRASGLEVFEGRAEDLPIANASVDAIVCSVVLPYTDERQAVAEWARVLKPGGAANVTFHGLGYGLTYLLKGNNLRRRIYGLRMLVNTLLYQLFSRRLAGRFGDTLCQTTRRMRSYYRSHGLILERVHVAETMMGFPRYLCHRVIKHRA